MEQLPWVMSGYLAASAVATPIYGKLSDLYGRRPLMLGSLLWLRTYQSSVQRLRQAWHS
jgi:MFS family permease